MSRLRRFAKPLLALIAVGVLGLAVAGCAFLKAGSLKASQPQGIGSVRVHFELCTSDEELHCAPNEEGAPFQYLAGIAVPPGSVPPQTFTATPLNGGTPLDFKLDEEVTSEITAASAAAQTTLSMLEGGGGPEEEAIKQVFGAPWPPSGLQGVGYISQAVLEEEGENHQWSVDADFGLPSPSGAPFTGPFQAAIAFGARIAAPQSLVEELEPPAKEEAEELSEHRPVHCLRIAGTFAPEETDAFCSGTLQQTPQMGTSDLRISAPAKPARVFVGGEAKVGFPMQYGGTTATVPTFALSGTTTAKGAKVAGGSFTPGSPDPTTHLSPAATGTAKVSLPKNIKPGTYQVTLTATTSQGGSVSQTGKLKVTKPTLKFGAAKRNTGNGTATLKVKVPGAGKLTIGGKGVHQVKKKTGKAKALKVKIAATGKAAAALQKEGKAKLKLKATFKPKSGISVSKSKAITLKLK